MRAARSAACKNEGWPTNRPEPHAWGTSHGSVYNNLRRDGYAQEHDLVAIAEGGRRGEVRFVGEILSRPDSVAKMVDRLAAKHGKLAFCYEAGPCGYGLHRQVTMLGRSWPKVPAGEACWNGQRRDDCVVVAPSLVPTRPGDRVKTARRDATTLSALFRSGELTPVWVRDDAHEAMRDLCRARQV
ncbi:MAG: hypothetical protein DLM68_14500 [Hyphomicrobiales bacterium]|nr:MAG: hypothetical protein DLM68_14500 [Hyphomicrobiales bacterium]